MLTYANNNHIHPNYTMAKCRSSVTGTETLYTLICTSTMTSVTQFIINIRYPEVWDSVNTSADKHVDNGAALPHSQDAHSPPSVN